jgi:RNA polymerase sigma factor (sigma-70 family)
VAGIIHQMPDANDMDLVREFARNNSETAFTGLVQRHVNLVYSVARRCTGNDSDAQDVTQAVFIILARKAASLSEKTILPGWLYETTRFTAARLLRTNIRRQVREQEVYMQSTLNEADSTAIWEKLAPHLETAMSKLAERDRALLVLRFYENKSGPETAALLGIREDAAHKRVARAIEKLRKIFAQRGVAVSGAAIAGAVSANSVQAAPVTIVKTITTIAVTKGAVATTSTLTLVKGALKVMAWTKVKTAVAIGIGILVAAGGVTVICETFQNKNASDFNEVSGAVADPMEMHIQWEVGKKYSMSREYLYSRTETPILPKRPEQKAKLAQKFDISVVKELDNGGWQLELTFENTTMNFSEGGRELLDFDSAESPARDAQGPVIPILRAIVGARIEYFTDTDGNVQKIEGLDDLTQRIMMAGNTPAAAMVKQAFGGDVLKHYVSLGNGLPDHPVKMGEGWSVKNNLPSDIGLVTLDQTNTFKDWEDRGERKCAHIEWAGDYSTQGAPMKSHEMVEIQNWKSSGEFWFDPTLGMMTAADNEQNRTLKVTRHDQIITLQISEKIHFVLMDVR